MTTQQATEQQAEAAKARGAGGSPAQQADAKNIMPQWIADGILAEATREAEFNKFVRSAFVDPDMAKHKEAAAARERSLLGQVSAAKAYQTLTDEQRAEILDAQANRDEAIEVASERGVPKDLLEDFPTAKSVRAFAKKYIAANGNGKPAGAKAETDVDAIAAKVREMLGGAKNPVDAKMPGSAGGGAGRTSGEIIPAVFDPRGGHVKQMLEAQKRAAGR